MSISIATVNVNGIRAAFRKGMGEWLAERGPDIVLMQETRAPIEVVQGFFQESDGWHVAVQPCEIKGRAGVAIASKLPIIESRTGLAAYQLPSVEEGRMPRLETTAAPDAITAPQSEPPVDTGRWIEADFELPNGTPLTAVSVYFHSGTNTPELIHTMHAKYAHLDKADKRLKELYAKAHPVIVAGDFNIAHQNNDIANWKGNKNSAGFLPEERAYLTKWFGADGWTDLGRHHAGDVEGPYTWWSWRGQAFTNDRGWRIDYHAANQPAAAATQQVIVDRHPTYEQRWSDHAPVIAELNL